MLFSVIQAIIQYRHKPEEVAELDRAIQPLADHIRAVASGAQRVKLMRILGCEFFQARDAKRARDMLLCAANHARAHLSDYFPLMQQDVIAQAEHLEDAANAYYRRFRYLQSETIPVH